MEESTDVAGKKSCLFEGKELPHGSEMDTAEDALICIDGKWVSKDSLVSVGC